jgi:transketolase
MWADKARSQARAIGTVIGLEHFGASSPYQRIYQEFGLTAAHVIDAARALLAKR